MAVVGGLTVAAAEVAIRALARDADRIDDATLADRVLAYEHLRRVLASEEAQMVARWEASGEWSLDGHRSTKTALAHRAGISGSAAASIVRRSRKLPRLDVLARALDEGRISLEILDTLCRLATTTRLAVELENQQELLVTLATALSHDHFAQALVHWKRCADPDGPEPAEITNRFDVHKHPDGRRTLSGDLDAVDGAEFDAALAVIERELFLAEWEEAEGEWGDAITTDRLARTPSERRAAALVEMARRALAGIEGGQKPEPLVMAVADPSTIDAVLDAEAGIGDFPTLDFETSMCELLDGTPISPRQLGLLLRRGQLDRTLADIDPSTRTSQRTFSGRLRRRLILRDRRCRWPGCGLPANRCQGDHIKPDSQGGPTSLENGQLLCPRHNRLKDPRGGPSYQVRRTTLEQLAYWRPDGTPIPTRSTLGRPRRHPRGETDPP